MRYNNKIYSIKSTNLNNSLVFYHALFDTMPSGLDESSMIFEQKDFTLIVNESRTVDATDQLILHIEDDARLEAVNRRMSRFRSIARMNNACEVLDKAIGLLDPDGNKWIIGDPNTEVQFEKCYIKS